MLNQEREARKQSEIICVEGYLSPEAVFIDGTHIKANANIRKVIKKTIERVFADAEEKHSMRFTYLRGLTRVTNWVRLEFAAMNLKKHAIHRRICSAHAFVIWFFSPYRYVFAC